MAYAIPLVLSPLSARALWPSPFPTGNIETQGATNLCKINLRVPNGRQVLLLQGWVKLRAKRFINRRILTYDDKK